MEWSQIHALLNLLFRWFHVIAGIAWIGQTYLFNWMEKTLPKEIDPKADNNVSGQLWMVHGGGFSQDHAPDTPLVQMGICAHLDQWYVSAYHCLLHGRTYV